MNASDRQGPLDGPASAPSARPRVCVIGAGISGLVSLRALREAGLSCQAFEQGSRVGGLWQFQNDNGRGGAYRSLTINTSARAMQLDGAPWPPGTPDYPHHSEVARYFEDYAQRFDLLRHIRFKSEVLKCEPVARPGGYLVTWKNLADGQVHSEHFDALIVANGHHWAPRWPEPLPSGKFAGDLLHSHDYIDSATPLELRGRRVVVVGMGNSAVDIACELARPEQASHTVLSARRGVWVIPKYLLGKPVDQGSLVPHWLPAKMRRRIVTWLFRLWVGRMPELGLPEPDHLIGEAHPTLSSELPGLVKQGRITMRPAIREFDGQRVIFADGAVEEADAIVFATGYAVRFPFFDEGHVAAPDNELPLFGRVFHPLHRQLFFVGLAQPLGAIMPIAELQARWIAEHLAGRYSLPAPEALEEAIARERLELRARYVRSPRHTMQIDPVDYVRTVQREVERGRRRAALWQGQAFPREAEAT